MHIVVFGGHYHISVILLRHINVVPQNFQAAACASHNTPGDSTGFSRTLKQFDCSLDLLWWKHLVEFCQNVAFEGHRGTKLWLQ